MKLDGPDDKLKRQLAAKVEALRALEASYTRIVDTGAAEWGIASLTRLGSAYEDFGQAIDTSDVPDHLTADQADLYDLRRRDLVYNQNQRAAASYRAAIERSHELNLYNAVSAEASVRLAAIAPDEASALFEVLPPPRFVASSITLARMEE